jgi:hypothetical protein
MINIKQKNHHHVRQIHVKMAAHVFKSAQVDICVVVRLVFQVTIVLSTLESIQQQQQQQRLLLLALTTIALFVKYMLAKATVL